MATASSLALVLASLLVAQSAGQSSSVVTQVWGGCTDSDPSCFPEFATLTSNTMSSPPANGMLTGLCFSGGGSRAYTAAQGQLRGLNALGLLSQFDYISSVSGGSWASSVAAFSTNADITTVLGPALNPADITMSNLQAPFAQNDMGQAVSYDVSPTFSSTLLEDTFQGHTFWIQSVGTFILGKFGLYSGSASNPYYITLNSTIESDITSANPSLANAQFLLPRSTGSDYAASTSTNYPFVIINTCISGTANEGPFTNTNVPFEVTPLYAGTPIPVQASNAQFSGLVGGAYVQPFAFGTDSIIQTANGSQQQGQQQQVDVPASGFTLADAVGSSSVAYSSLVSAIGDAFSPTWLYNVDESLPSGDSYVFSDGYSVDNNGLLSLLRRRVQRVVVFINTDTPINTTPGMSPCT